MNPDYRVIVEEFLNPVITFFLFAFMILGWIVAYQAMKEVTELRIKLGRESHPEEFKLWLLRKSAYWIFPFYTLKNYLVEKQLQPAIYYLKNRRKKVLRLAYKWEPVVLIRSTIFQIVLLGINSGKAKN